MTEPVADDVVVTETEFCTIARHPGPLLHMIAKVHEHGGAEARQLGEFAANVHRESGHRVRILVDMRLARGLNREARVYYQSDEYTQHIVGIALIVDSGISRVLGNFFIGLNKGAAVTRLFTDVDEARAWLLSLREG